MTDTPPLPADDARLAFALAALLVVAEVVPRLGGAGDDDAPLALRRYLVDVNEAPAAEIEALPSVGRVLAGRIVAERGNGAFTSIDDLGRVPGVGPTTLERMRPFVTCGGQ